MVRKLNDYMSELSSYLERNGGTVLECSYCGHAVAVVGFDVKTFCEYTITCAECKKEKPLIDTPIHPDPFYWQKWNNPPAINPAGPWWQNPITSVDQSKPETIAINNAANHNFDSGGVQGISASNPDINVDWHMLTNEPWDKYCTCGVKFDIINEHVPGCGFLVEKKRLIEYKASIEGYGIH